MNLLELLQSVCDSYPEDLSYNTVLKDVVLRIKSEKFNCDIEYRLNRVYTDDQMYGDIVFEFSDD